MKQFHGAHQFAKAISASADEIAKRVIDRYDGRGIKGREEDISSQLAGELTDHLVDEIRKNIKEISLKEVDFDAITYKKKTEKKVGADLGGSIIYKAPQGNQAKVFLAQAKVATSALKTDAHTLTLEAGDERLLSQCKNMLAITPASFVFIYSKFGVHVVPAASVVRSGKSSINTQEHYYRGLGSFYEEVYKCFVGDLSLGDSYRDEEKMKEFSVGVKASRALAITVEPKRG